MADMWVVDTVLISLLIQEVKHVFDGQGQGRAAVCCAEDGLKQVVHELLQRALGRGGTGSHRAPHRSAAGGFRVCLAARGRGEQYIPRVSLGETGYVHALNLPTPDICC